MLNLGDMVVPLQAGEQELWRGPYVATGGVRNKEPVKDLVVIITDRRVIIGRTGRTHTPDKGCMFYLLCFCCCYHDIMIKTNSVVIIDAKDVKGVYVSSTDVTDKANCMLCCGAPAVNTATTTVRLQLHSMTTPILVAPPSWGLDGQTIDGIVVEGNDVSRVLGALSQMMASNKA